MSSTILTSPSSSSDKCLSTSECDSCERRLLHRRRIEQGGFHEHELSVCADSISHWVNHWVYTEDPREKGGALPFDLFPRQEELLTWLGEREAARESGIVEKSRDTGVSWICCLYALHGWLFRPGFRCGFGSRKLEYVDRKGDMKTIFEKIRFALWGLPAWMLPKGFKHKEYDCHAKLINPALGNTITGEGGDEIGRGDRTTLYFVDEAAYLEHPQKVDSALSATTNVRIDVSTPNGPGNSFAQKRHSGVVPVFTFHWRSDPRKTQEWYDDFKRVNGPEVTAEQLDIDYAASLEGICIPAKWVRAAINLDLVIAGTVVAGLDIAEFGRDRNVWIARQGPVVRQPLDWGQCNTTETAHRAADETRRVGAAVLSYDCIGVGAGVRGTLDTAERPWPFTTNAVNVGEAPSDDYWPDGKTSKEKFVNLRAELWWKLRARFERAYERATGVAQHRDEDCISIPDHPQLIQELSLPLVRRKETGKLFLESKEDMRKRGVKSPNFADALALAFASDGADWVFGYETGRGAYGDAPHDVTEISQEYRELMSETEGGRIGQSPKDRGLHEL
jgi:hypothetical protein